VAALEKVARYNDLDGSMGEPAVMANPTRFTKVVKETRPARQGRQAVRRFSNSEAQIQASEKWSAAETDPEMRVYAEEELAGLRITKHAQMRMPKWRRCWKARQDSTA